MDCRDDQKHSCHLNYTAEATGRVILNSTEKVQIVKMNMIKIYVKTYKKIFVLRFVN